MVASNRSDLTELLRRASEGDHAAAEQVFDAIYGELRRNARTLLRSRAPGQTLDPDSLLHEAYLKVSASRQSDWQNRGHFLAVMSRAMRQIMLDDIKRKRRARHGGELRRVPLSGVVLRVGEEVLDVGGLHLALAAVERQDPEASQLLELTYFVGLTAAEAAEGLGVSESTVVRELKWAKTLLRAELVR